MTVQLVETAQTPQAYLAEFKLLATKKSIGSKPSEHRRRLGGLRSGLAHRWLAGLRVPEVLREV